jgi:hypothetical protein
MPVNVPTEDRLAIYDNAFRYAWALDTMDPETLAETFTASGQISTTSGDVFTGADGVKQFGRNAFAIPGHAGRQHHIQPLFFDAGPEPGSYLMTSYWMVVTWDAGTAPRIVSLGWYKDVCVRDGGAWKFASKAILRWDSETAPVVPPLA